MVYDLAINPAQSGTRVILKGSPHESGVVYDLAIKPTQSGTWVILKGSAPWKRCGVRSGYQPNTIRKKIQIKWPAPWKRYGVRRSGYQPNTTSFRLKGLPQWERYTWEPVFQPDKIRYKIQIKGLSSLRMHGVSPAINPPQPAKWFNSTPSSSSGRVQNQLHESGVVYTQHHSHVAGFQPTTIRYRTLKGQLHDSSVLSTWPLTQHSQIRKT